MSTTDINVARAACEINAELLRRPRDAMRIGELLVQVKQSLARGDWSAWLRANVKPVPAARQCMRAYRAAASIPAGAPKAPKPKPVAPRDTRKPYWDRPKLERFEMAYHTALNAHAAAFTFEGRDFDMAVALKLIGRLDHELPHPFSWTPLEKHWMRDGHTQKRMNHLEF